ncbi:MAG: LytR/AlgR family response regulator transcription factor [Flavobacteriales bacterium]
MQTHNVLIVDDEPAQHQLLSRMLAEGHSNMRLVGVCHTVDQAHEFLRSVKPDLLFLDVMMPGRKGYELLHELEVVDFEVIFTTSYDNYALQAFRLSAVDYLLKPFGPVELRAAIEKYEARLQQQYNNERLKALLANLNGAEGSEFKIAVSTNRGTAYVNLPDVIRIESGPKLNMLHTKNEGQVPTTFTMNELDDMLHDKGFFRIHNSYIVNMNCVKALVKKGDSRMVVTTDGFEMELARRRRDEFVARMGE